MLNPRLFLPLLLSALLLSAFQCKKNNPASSCYKGRVEVAGICGNTTIKLLEGALPASQIEDSWKDPVTGKTHTNVFALKSICTFPATLKQGDEFYFTLAESTQNCAVCQAYYPTPSKGLSIRVLDKPCMP